MFQKYQDKDPLDKAKVTAVNDAARAYYAALSVLQAYRKAKEILKKGSAYDSLS